MELKIHNPDAEAISEYFGISVERIIELSKDNAKEIAKYFGKVCTNSQPSENELLKDVIKNCNTWEEAIFLALYFIESLEYILERNLKILEKQEKEN
jgi:hypothetical protein